MRRVSLLFIQISFYYLFFLEHVLGLLVINTYAEVDTPVYFTVIAIRIVSNVLYLAVSACFYCNLLESGFIKSDYCFKSFSLVIIFMIAIYLIELANLRNYHEFLDFSLNVITNVNILLLQHIVNCVDISLLVDDLCHFKKIKISFLIFWGVFILFQALFMLVVFILGILHSSPDWFKSFTLMAENMIIFGLLNVSFSIWINLSCQFKRFLVELELDEEQIRILEIQQELEGVFPVKSARNV